MLRRQHKKSRKGCTECKRRHMRCDEQRPTCFNCIKADRLCSFGEEPYIRGHDVSPRSNHHSARTPPDFQPNGDPDAVNMLHMELLLHFSFDVYVPEFDDNLGRPATELVLDIAQEAPFLMQGVLAMSARHLSIIRPEKSALYLNQAVRLQTRAIEMFNMTHHEEGRSTCVARLLFSSVLGRHILADVLRDDGLDFPSFLNRFTHGVRIHGGVKAVAAQQDWVSLLETEFGPLMTRGLAADMYDKTIEPNEALQSLITQSSNLDEEERSACEMALRLVDTGLHDLRDPTRVECGRRMMFTWSIMLSDRYICLLERQAPEALVILARYSMFLHFGRSFWQIGEAGPHLLHAISAHLGPMWQPWLSWPEEIHDVEHGTFSGTQGNVLA
ncbi:hypothetical protein CLIM01_03141 [Colletotrichum limetticola]|uniref:Zn(2)-C6 fungal-type domain-containing protein n=1 Tax=Colletotrichum limetticola TaxID=1209924 RepID=A0ABQ9Q742_9PEZI|nr:hypothetical protein CLIM01_03141 [Colletotrichum limetticola]